MKKSVTLLLGITIFLRVTFLDNVRYKMYVHTEETLSLDFIKGRHFFMAARNLLPTILIGSIGLSSCTDNNRWDLVSDFSYVNRTCFTEEGLKLNIPQGVVQLGSNDGYAEERPLRMAELSSFNIDATEVTNREFQKFVLDTGYVTSAEKVQPGFGVRGAAVFMIPDQMNHNWWRFVEGANWRHPEGPDSSIEGREMEPVVQVSHSDAKAYAMWAGRTLPTEVQWEYAALAGSDTRYIWGDTRTIDDVEQANTWQGAFPFQNTKNDGFLKRAPVGCYPPNGFGLFDMIGNVWEWTDTEYQQSEGEPIYVIKGGSFLCSENFCRRYRPAAKQPQEAGFSTNHIGFRTVGSDKEEPS